MDVIFPEHKKNRFLYHVPTKNMELEGNNIKYFFEKTLVKKIMSTFNMKNVYGYLSAHRI